MPLFTFGPQRAFSELSDREVLALAVQAEEEDGRLYREFAESLKADYPGIRQGLRRDGGGGERAPPPAPRALPASASAIISR